jgi:hypothetical protein
MINRGTQVRIKDGSYMATQLENGEISHSSPEIRTIGHNKDEWTVLLINIALPTHINIGNRANTYHNNILIQNNSNGELWFCSLINIYEI